MKRDEIYALLIVSIFLAFTVLVYFHYTSRQDIDHTSTIVEEVKNNFTFAECYINLYEIGFVNEIFPEGCYASRIPGMFEWITMNKSLQYVNTNYFQNFKQKMGCANLNIKHAYCTKDKNKCILVDSDICTIFNMSKKGGY